MMKGYFKKWQFWLRVFTSPVGWFLNFGHWIGEKIADGFESAFYWVDDLLPDIPETKQERRDRFNKADKDL